MAWAAMQMSQNRANIPYVRLETRINAFRINGSQVGDSDYQRMPSFTRTSAKLSSPESSG
jgi:hypothetical protein